MDKAFAYLRVSSKGQVDGDGFERQILACQKYAASHDIDIIEVFREEGVSGTTELDNRPALSELFAALEENGIKTVIVEKLDRLARDLMIQETIIADIKKSGYVLHSTCEPDLCSNDPSRILMRQIFGAIAQYDKTMIVQKLRAARQRKKAKTGKGEGRHAFGEKAEEKPTLALMLQYKQEGKTTRQITDTLNASSIPTRMGAPWKSGTVAKILLRQKARAKTEHLLPIESMFYLLFLTWHTALYNNVF